MLRLTVAVVVLLAAHLGAGSASAQGARCRLGFVPAKTDQIKALRYQGIAEIRGTSLFYEATVGAVDKTGRSFLLMLSSTNMNALSRLASTGVLSRVPALCARIDPTSYLARTQKLVPGSSLSARYNSYEVDAAQVLPK